MGFVWLFFYGLVSLLGSCLASVSPWAYPGGLFISTGLAVAWLMYGQQGYLLTLPRQRLRTCLLFLPCLLPALCNLLAYGFFMPPILDAVCIFFAAVREEVLFRGILLCFLCRRNTVGGILLSGLAFAAAHLLNLENAAEPAVVCCQAVYALAAGLALAGVAVFCGSLLPCVAIHFLNNLTVGEVTGLPEASGFLFWFCVAVWLICGFVCIFILRRNCSGEGENL